MGGRSDGWRRAVAAAVLAFAGAVAAAADGRPPQRIVSMVPAFTEATCALGTCERLVGVDRHSNWPERVRDLPQVGSLEDAQVERIVALRPDLVIVAPGARARARLEALGLPVLVLQADTLAEMRAATETLARALGSPGGGERLWQRIDARVAAAAARVPPAWRGQRVYVEVSPMPHAAGEASFIGELLARLGLRNVVPAALGPFPQLSPEYVLRARPALVVAAAQAVAEMPQRPGWGRLDALRAGHVCALAPAQYDLLVRPGPRLDEAADVIADCVAALGNGR